MPVGNVFITVQYIFLSFVKMYPVVLKMNLQLPL